MLIIDWNAIPLNTLVNTSTSWPSINTNGVQISPLSNFSFIKCLSTSICLVRTCYIRLCVISIVDLLSQYSLIGSSHTIFRSSKIIFNHRSSQTPNAIALNSSFALDLAITFASCFSMLQCYLRGMYNSLKLIFCHQSI